MNRRWIISNLPVVISEKKEIGLNFSTVENALNHLPIGYKQDIIISGNALTGQYKMHTYLKVDKFTVELVKSAIHG